MSTIVTALPSFICPSVRLSSRAQIEPYPIFLRDGERVHRWTASPGSILSAIEAADHWRPGGSDESDFLDGLAHRGCAARARRCDELPRQLDVLSVRRTWSAGRRP